MDPLWRGQKLCPLPPRLPLPIFMVWLKSMYDNDNASSPCFVTSGMALLLTNVTVGGLHIQPMALLVQETAPDQVWFLTSNYYCWEKYIFY